MKKSILFGGHKRKVWCNVQFSKNANNCVPRGVWIFWGVMCHMVHEDFMHVFWMG